MQRLPTLLICCAVAVPVALAIGGCGVKGAATGGAGGPKGKPVDADPYALLPPAALAVSRVDAASLFGNPTVGADLKDLADSFVPLDDDSGFKASRDVTRVIVATYDTTGGDVAVVLSGHFDRDRIAHAIKTKAGATIGSEVHGALTEYHAGRDAWAPLTTTTLVAGTPEGVALVLDRVAKGKLDRWEAPWMMATLETSTAALALAADFTSRPLASASLGALGLPWVEGIRQIKGTGTLTPDSLGVDLTVSYANTGQVKDAEGGIERSVHVLDLLGPVIGIRLQGFQTTIDGQDLHGSFTLDSQTLRSLVGIAPRLAEYVR